VFKGEIPMHYSFLSRIRDILLLCSLLFLIKIAFEQTKSFIELHKKSMVHELDRDFIDQLYTAQRQLHFLEENHTHNEQIAGMIADLKERLAIIEERYKTNSPAVMLLGPIGSTAIVTKEEKLKKKLLEIANEITKIMNTIHNIQDESQPAETISVSLENNKKLLRGTGYVELLAQT
jgi:hypothetical protein